MFNMLNILIPILEYLSHLLSDFQTVFAIVMNIYFHVICEANFSVKYV